MIGAYLAGVLFVAGICTADRRNHDKKLLIFLVSLLSWFSAGAIVGSMYNMIENNKGKK